MTRISLPLFLWHFWHYSCIFFSLALSSFLCSSSSRIPVHSPPKLPPYSEITELGWWHHQHFKKTDFIKVFAAGPFRRCVCVCVWWWTLFWAQYRHTHISKCCTAPHIWRSSASMATLCCPFHHQKAMPVRPTAQLLNTWQIYPTSSRKLLFLNVPPTTYFHKVPGLAITWHVRYSDWRKGQFVWSSETIIKKSQKNMKTCWGNFFCRT